MVRKEKEILRIPLKEDGKESGKNL